MTDREIILALFHPQTAHVDGCLFKADSRMPCQCGYAETIGNYKAALRHAKRIATEHYGSAYASPEPA